MFVGIMKIELSIPSVLSIKDKRKVVNSVKAKISNRFKISVSEVEDQELYDSSVLGLSFVSLVIPTTSPCNTTVISSIVSCA